MAKRGRPAVEIGPKQFLNIVSFLKGISFYTKAQAAFLNDLRCNLSDPDKLALVKTNLRQMKGHREREDFYKIIQHKATTNIVLTALEKEILAYDLKDRDGFFSCHRALNTYQKLDKITQTEIERKQSQHWQEKIKKGQDNQSEAQKKRMADNRRKYFLGGVLQKYVSFLKENDLFAVDVSEEQVLTGLIEETIVSKFLSDVTGGDEVRAASVKKSIQAKHPMLMNALSLMAEAVVLDKRKGDEI
jgi:hypothetical protein